MPEYPGFATFLFYAIMIAVIAMTIISYWISRLTVKVIDGKSTFQSLTWTQVRPPAFFYFVFLCAYLFTELVGIVQGVSPTYYAYAQVIPALFAIISAAIIPWRSREGGG